MNKTLTKSVGFIGLTGVIAIVIAACFTVSRTAFTNITALGDFISAFTGAFFAFVFVKLGELGTRIYTRQRVNQTALVTLEQVLQEYVNRLYDNEFIADDIIETIDATTKNQDGALKVNFNYLKPLPIDKSLTIDLRNLDYKNDLFDFFEDLEKLNRSLDSIQHYYDLMTTNLMSGQLSHENYMGNLPIIKEKLHELKGFIVASIEDCVDVATKTCLLLQEPSF